MNRLLVVTDDPAEFGALKMALGRLEEDAEHGRPFEFVWSRKLADATERLKQDDIDAIIVNLTLPDSEGIATFDRLFAAWPHTPIMVLSATAGDVLALEAVRRGAQGYISGGNLESNLIPLALRAVIRSRAVEQAYHNEKARAEIALNSISDAVICTDITGRIDYLNIAAEKITGWSRDEARGHPITDVFKLINGITREPERNPVELVLEKNEAMGLLPATILVKRDGTEAAIEDSCSPIHNWQGNLTGVVIVFHDVTAAQAMVIKMAYLAQHDFLTNLPNRVLLSDRMAQAIALARRRHMKLAVLFLDLDNFKNINDSLGHVMGDKLLQSVARRLKECVRGSDTVSRQGGDEFVVLLAESRSNEDVSAAAAKITAALTAPHRIGARELHVTTSIGISVFPTDGKDAETLIKSADTAMYHAKENGRNNCQFFKSDMHARAVERQFIEASLRRALENKEFVLHYQPKVNLSTGAVTGAEALLRWKHPEWGIVLPTRFIPVAEECGLIVPIGQWVLREACEQARQWLDEGLEPSISVNISALELRQENFVAGMRATLSETDLAAHWLQLEITESVLMRDAEVNRAILQQLKDMGVELAVDDFGTGYSSLSYLTQFPIDVLKIDQSFVNDITATPRDGVIASAVIGMGNSLDLRVIAEGVETRGQLDFLKARHCEEGQGYLFSRPLIARDYALLLSNVTVKAAS